MKKEKQILDNYFVGVMLAPSARFNEFFDDPYSHVPRTYGQAAADKYVGDLTQSRMAKAPMLNLSGALHEVVVIDDRDSILLQAGVSAKVPPLMVAQQFLNFIISIAPRQFSTSVRFGDTEPTSLFFGFDIKEGLRIAAAQVLQNNMTLSVAKKMLIPVRLWHNPMGVFDPLDIMLNGSERSHFDAESLLKFFGLVSAEPGDSALSKAVKAHGLVEAGQMVR